MRLQYTSTVRVLTVIFTTSDHSILISSYSTRTSTLVVLASDAYCTRTVWALVWVCSDETLGHNIYSWRPCAQFSLLHR